jgi:predicted phosphodiesterase
MAQKATHLLNCQPLVVLLCVLQLTYVAQCHCQAQKKDSCKITENREVRFAFISDTQVPLWFEKLFVSTHRNEEASSILLQHVSQDSTLSAVFFLGDVTAMSSFDDQWKVIDTSLSRFSRSHLPTYAVAGNHDYLLFPGEALGKFKNRFPSFVQTGYTVRIGHFALILLNSNFDNLSQKERSQQQTWYLDELDLLRQDTTIQIIAVACHHPPFSNSSIVGYSQKVRDDFIPPFLQSQKCKVFFSGHAHTFQHFIDTLTEKHFFVLGGGGGLLHKLSQSATNDLPDQFHSDSEFRLFHYIHCKLEQDTLQLSVLMLSADLSGPNPVYNVCIPIDEKTK